MKTWLTWVTVLVLMGCSEVPGSPYAGPNQPRVVPNGMSVTIVNARSEEEAQPWAAAYCAKLGKTAHFLGMELYNALRHQRTDSASFDCVSS
jgi:hypothetical protein